MKNKSSFFTKWYVVFFLAFVCCFLWGSAFPTIKIGYKLLNISADDMASQILFAGIRFFLAGIFAIIIGSVLKKEILLPTKKSVGSISLLCLFQTVVQYFCFYVGLANTTGVKGAIITGSNTLIAIIFACLIFHQEKITTNKVIGCIIGFAGVIIANISGEKLNFDFSFMGEGMMLISAVSYALSSVFLKNFSKKYDPVMLSGYQFVLGGIVLAVIGIIMGGKINTWTNKSIFVIAYLAFVSAVAYSLWGVLLKYNPVSTVTVYGFMNPIIGVLLSAIMIGERKQAFNPKNIIALILVASGIYIVNKVSSKKTDKHI